MPFISFSWLPMYSFFWKSLEIVVHRVETCQNAFVSSKNISIIKFGNKAISTRTQWVHITPVPKVLHWLPIHFWSKYKRLVITFKFLHGLGPDYLRQHLLYINFHADITYGGSLTLVLNSSGSDLWSNLSLLPTQAHWVCGCVNILISFLKYLYKLITASFSC